MISRTAFTQLRYSTTLLALTLLGLTLVWLVPTAAILFGPWLAVCRGSDCGRPVGHQLPAHVDSIWAQLLWALALPLIALFYMAATCGSALDYWRGRGARWKSRAYGSG